MSNRVNVFRRKVRLALPAVCFAAFLAGLPVTASAQTWGPLTVLSPGVNSSYAGPVIDSLGNAWMVIDDTVNLSVVESNGTSGGWQNPHVLGPWIVYGGFAAALTVDRSGGVYVVYNATQNVQQGSFPLMWAKYTPASGWQGPWLAYNSPHDFGEVIPAIDSTGRLVVVFNANGVSSIVYDPAHSSWGPVQNLVPIGLGPVLPSMAGNAGGSRLALVYLGLRGLEYSFFNSSSGKWNQPALVPGGEERHLYQLLRKRLFPDRGRSVRQRHCGNRLGHALSPVQCGGFRYDGASWQLTQLTPPIPVVTTVEFGSIAQSPSGAVLVAVPYNAYKNGKNNLIMAVFRYTPGIGWDTETAAPLSDNLVTRCAVAWFGSGDAVVVYLNNPLPPAQQVESAAIYRNGTWSGGPAIPGGYGTYSPGITTAPNGDVLFAMQSRGGPPPYSGTGTVVTWLRP